MLVKKQIYILKILNGHKNNFLFISYFLLFVSIFILTNQYWSLTESVSYGFPDYIIYDKIASCGKSLTLNTLINLKIPEHFAERWIPNFIIGYISKITSIDVLFIFRFFIFLIYFLIFYIIFSSDYKTKNKILYFIFITFNPYSFRCYIAGGYNINDCLFYFSVFLFIFSIIENKTSLIFISIFFAIISKQTVIFFIPIIFLFYKKKSITKLTCISSIMFLIIMGIMLKISVIHLFKPMPSSTLRHIYALFTWPFENPKLTHLYLFFSRIIFFLLLLSPLLFFNILSFKNKTLIFSSILIVLQPILAGPAITADGGIRLYVFALPLLFYPILNCQISNKHFFIVIIINLIISLHHNYTFLTYKYIYFIFVLFSFLFILIYKKYIIRLLN